MTLQEDYKRAIELLEEGVALSREIGIEGALAGPLLNLGWAALGQGDNARATKALRESLTLIKATGYQGAVVAESLEAMAVLAGAREEFVRAARLWGAAGALRELYDSPVAPVERDRYERYLASVRFQPDEEAWEAAWEKGQAMTMEEAVSYAMVEEEAGG